MLLPIDILKKRPSLLSFNAGRAREREIHETEVPWFSSASNLKRAKNNFKVNRKTKLLYIACKNKRRARRTPESGLHFISQSQVRLYHTAVSSTSRSPQISGQLIRDAITVYRVVYQQDDLVRQRRVKRCRDNFRARNRRAAVRSSASVLPRPPPSLI